MATGNRAIYAISAVLQGFRNSLRKPRYELDFHVFTAQIVRAKIKFDRKKDSVVPSHFIRTQFGDLSKSDRQYVFYSTVKMRGKILA